MGVACSAVSRTYADVAVGCVDDHHIAAVHLDYDVEGNIQGLKQFETEYRARLTEFLGQLVSQVSDTNNYTRSKSELDLITRRVIQEKEGDDAQKYLSEYADPNSQRYADMLEAIRKEQNFTTLRYHRLDDLIASIGLSPCKVCTYCFNGVE